MIPVKIVKVCKVLWDSLAKERFLVVQDIVNKLGKKIFLEGPIQVILRNEHVRFEVLTLNLATLL